MKLWPNYFCSQNVSVKYLRFLSYFKMHWEWFKVSKADKSRTFQNIGRSCQKVFAVPQRPVFGRKGKAWIFFTTMSLPASLALNVSQIKRQHSLPQGLGTAELNLIHFNIQYIFFCNRRKWKTYVLYDKRKLLTQNLWNRSYRWHMFEEIAL